MTEELNLDDSDTVDAEDDHFPLRNILIEQQR